MSVARRVAKNTFFLVSGQVLWTVFSIILLLFSARILGVEDFGNYGFAFAFVLLFSIIADFGFERAVVRDLARNRKAVAKYLGNLFVIKIIFCAFVFFLIALSINLLGYSESVVSATYLLGAYVVLNSLAALPRFVFKAFEEMHYDAFLTIFSKGTVMVFGIAALLSGFGLIGLAFAFFLSGLLTAILGFFIVVKKFSAFKPEFDFSFWKSLLFQNIPFALNSFFSSFSGRISTVLLSLLQGSFAVGIYSAAYKFLEGLQALPTLIVMPVYPVMSRYFLSSKAELQKAYYFAFKLLFILTLPLSFGVSVLALPLVQLLFGSSFSQSMLVLQILVWSIFFTFVNSASSNLLFAADRQKTVALFSGIGAFLTVALSLYLIPKISFTGAATAVLLSSMLVFLLSFIAAQKVVKLLKLAFIPKAILSCLVMSFAIIAFPFQEFFTLAALGILVYFACMFLLKGIDAEDLRLLKKVLGKKFVSPEAPNE
ncbi:MAG TPA: flippase [Candidatus Diapherotrites archaeon]|uniref:Flippase n=1 Tax=Candidatus Iainarchaeum sp. TaxID=3101447 RepID=A0A7J4KYI7_9ARCH|nr:flippase [Candidatus Diapherotrites archaeon]